MELTTGTRVQTVYQDEKQMQGQMTLRHAAFPDNYIIISMDEIPHRNCYNQTFMDRYF